MRRALLLVLVLALALVTLGAVSASHLAHDDDHGGGMGDDHGMGGDHGHGSGKNASVAADARKIRVTATNFAFAPKEISVRAGEDVAIVLTSKDAFHDFEVKGIGHVVGAKENKTKSGGLMLEKPGTYKFWCSVPGHRANGMRGTIVVQE